MCFLLEHLQPATAMHMLKRKTTERYNYNYIQTLSTHTKLECQTSGKCSPSTVATTAMKLTPYANLSTSKSASPFSRCNHGKAEGGLVLKRSWSTPNYVKTSASETLGSFSLSIGGTAMPPVWSVFLAQFFCVHVCHSPSAAET